MRAFVVRPFGIKRDIDFNRVGAELIRPALGEFEISGDTTGEFFSSGSIHVDMFRELLAAEVVIADISIHNANVFYELGVRHALRRCHTILIRARSSAFTPDEIPFDIAGFRYITYDPAQPGASLADLVRTIRETTADDKVDSPVFQSLRALDEPRRSAMLAPPVSFMDDVARAKQDGALLALYALEVMGLSWESEGLRTVGRAQARCRQFGAAKATWETIRSADEDDIEANVRLGNVYERLELLEESDRALNRVLSNPAAGPADHAEAHGQLGRNHKRRWLDEWRSAPAEQRRERALMSPALQDAYAEYLRAFQSDLDSYYPGLNALALAVIALKLQGEMPDAWTGCFGEEEGARKASDMKRKAEAVRGALALRVDAAGEIGLQKDVWLALTAAELKLLTECKPREVQFAFRKPAASLDDFARTSVRRQLQIYADLGVLAPQVAAALEAVEPGADEPKRPAKAIVFTGHRVDGPGRQNPRFPPEKEDIARQAIRIAVQREIAIADGEVAGFAGGASGGDILFHEVCAELGVSTTLLLALPPDKFVQASVSDAGPEWVQRFYALRRALPAHQLSEDETMPKWLRTKHGYGFWQRNNLWTLSHALASGAPERVLLALWNEEAGDGLGGTQDMVLTARKRGVRTEILSTRQLFAGA